MNIMHFISCAAYKSASVPLPHCVHPPPLSSGCYLETRLHTSHSNVFLPKLKSRSHSWRFSVGTTIPSDEGTASAFHFEDLVEKDWSFLQTDAEDELLKLDRIISAGDVKETSNVLVSIGSEAFVDRLCTSSGCKQLLVVHDSLITLASIKAKYDKVKCWQGELLNVPEKWTPLDVVYLYFLPALPFELGSILASLSKNCQPGARVVISHLKGRQAAEKQRQQFPDVVVSSLPENSVVLERAAAEHTFQLEQFMDEPGFYLAVLRLR